MPFGDLTPTYSVNASKKKAPEKVLSFETDILPTTLRHEGGYTVDTGGPTNYGITQKTLNAERALKGLAVMSVLDLAPKERDTLYKSKYFEGPQFHKLPSATSGIMFDFGVNAGPNTASRYLQQVVGATPDSVIGPNTLSKVNQYVEKFGAQDLNNKILDKLQAHYNGLIKNNPKKYGKYKKGWMNRIESLRKTYTQQAKAPAPVSNLSKGFRGLKETLLDVPAKHWGEKIESPYGAGPFKLDASGKPIDYGGGMGEREPFYEARGWKTLKDVASLAMIAYAAKEIVKLLENKRAIDTYAKFEKEWNKILDRIVGKAKAPLSQKQLAALEEVKDYIWKRYLARSVAQRVRGSVGVPPEPIKPAEPSEYVKGKMKPPDIKTFEVNAALPTSGVPLLNEPTAKGGEIYKPGADDFDTSSIKSIVSDLKDVVTEYKQKIGKLNDNISVEEIPFNKLNRIKSAPDKRLASLEKLGRTDGVTVIKEKGTYRVVDGQHRIALAEKQGKTSLLMIVANSDRNMSLNEIKSKLSPKEVAKGGEIEHLYHVTPTEYVDSIKESGLVPMKSPSNWVKAGDKKRYGKGEIYTFDNPTDAAKWATKMDWEFNKEIGSGKISIVQLKKSGEWTIDTSDPLSQSGKKGNWLKSINGAKKEDILQSIPLTSDITKKLTALDPDLSGMFSKLSPKEGGEPDKVRAFINTVKKAEKTAEPVRTIIESNYTPITNQETITKAQFLVNNNYNEALRLAMEDTSPTPDSVATALALIDKAQLENRWEDARTLIEQTAKRATKAGQATQALAMYERLTPEGVLRYADSTFKRALAGMSKEKLANWERLGKLADTDAKRQALAKKLGIPYLSDELMQKLHDMAVEIQTMPPGREKNIKIALLQMEIAKQIPSSILRKIAFGQTLAQLLNPKTIIRNLLGNAGFAGVESLSQSIGTALDIGVSQITGKRTTFLPSLGKEWGAGLKAGEEAAEEAMLGIEIGGGGTTKFDLPQGSIFNGGVLQGLEKTLNMVLRVPDRVAYSAAFNAHIENAMKAANATEPTLEMIEEAHAYGLWRTFQDDSALAKVFTSIKKALNAGQDFGLGDMVIKYPKTPANIIARGLEFSPVNLWRVVSEMSKPLLGQPFNQKKFVDASARTLTGSALLFGTGAALAGLGIITSDREKNRNVARFASEIGLGDYKINVSALKRFALSGMNPEAAKLQPGDILATYDWFQPNSTALAMGASAAKGGNWGEAVMEAANTIVEQPMISGVKRFMSTGNVIQGISKTLEGVPASFIPTLLNQVRQLVDNQSRNTRGVDFLSSLWNKVAYRIPGLSQTLPSNVTAFGEDKEVYLAGSNNPFNVFLNPSFVTKYKPTPASEMVMNIWKTTGETGQFPRYVPTYIMIGGTKRTLTPQEQHDLQSYIGNRTGVLYDILAHDEVFTRQPDDVKAKRLDGMLQDIYTAGKVEILGYQPKTYTKNVTQILQGINDWWKNEAYRREKTYGTRPSLGANRVGFKKLIP